MMRRRRNRSFKIIWLAIRLASTVIIVRVRIPIVSFVVIPIDVVLLLLALIPVVIISPVVIVASINWMYIPIVVSIIHVAIASVIGITIWRHIHPILIDATSVIVAVLPASIVEVILPISVIILILSIPIIMVVIVRMIV